MLRTLLIVALLPSLAFSQIDESTAKRGLEITLTDSNISVLAPGGQPRVNAMRVAPDGSGRRFLVLQDGEMYVVEPDGTVGLFYDFVPEFGFDFIRGGQTLGFSSMAFHPDFATNGRFYTVHAEDDTSSVPNQAPVYEPPSVRDDGIAPNSLNVFSVLSEWTATDPAANTWSGTRRELMRVRILRRGHVMGEVRFNPNAQPTDPDYGLLYASIGDGDSFRLNLNQNLQRLDSYYGTLIRIDPQGTDGPNGRYGIPAANPYAGDGDPNTFGEIIAYGFRNPHRFGWDTQSGALFLYDIGENNFEEINIIDPSEGANYGWPIKEGTFTRPDIPLAPEVLEGTVDDGFAYPAGQYDQPEGFAIAGGEACRGCGVPDLEGKILTGDIPQGLIFAIGIDDLLAANDGIPSTYVVPERVQIVFNGQRLSHRQIINQNVPDATRVDVRFGLDHLGRINVLNKHDGVIRVVEPGPCRADTTTTNTNPGDTGFGEADGVVDGADLSWFVEEWIAGGPGADRTTTNTNPGEIGFGVLDGTVDGADLSWFVELWLSGCP